MTNPLLSLSTNIREHQTSTTSTIGTTTIENLDSQFRLQTIQKFNRCERFGDRKKLKFLLKISSSTKPQNSTFRKADSRRTTTNWAKVEDTVFMVRCANLWRTCRRQRHANLSSLLRHDVMCNNLRYLDHNCMLMPWERSFLKIPFLSGV